MIRAGSGKAPAGRCAVAVPGTRGRAAANFTTRGRSNPAAPCA
jgi:hypothetical protein